MSWHVCKIFFKYDKIDTAPSWLREIWAELKRKSYKTEVWILLDFSLTEFAPLISFNTFFSKSCTLLYHTHTAFCTMEVYQSWRTQTWSDQQSRHWTKRGSLMCAVWVVQSPQLHRSPSSMQILSFLAEQLNVRSPPQSRQHVFKLTKHLDTLSLNG